MSVSLCLRVMRQVERRCLRCWLPVLLRKCNHNCIKRDNMVEEVDLAAANTSYVQYAYIGCKGGREHGGKSWRCVRLVGRPFSTSEFAERKCSLLEIEIAHRHCSTLAFVGRRYSMCEFANCCHISGFCRYFTCYYSYFTLVCVTQWCN